MPNPSGANGRISAPPDDILRIWIPYYVYKGFKNHEIVQALKHHYDTDQYNASEALIKKRRSQWGIFSARGQAHTIHTIDVAMQKWHKVFPTCGSREMKSTLLQREGIAVSQKIVGKYMKMHWPDEVEARKMHAFIRKVFHTAGVNDIWVDDQHDKQRKYQLYYHVGIEPFSGRILWLKVWWTNRNPRLVCSWYLDVVEELQCIPLLTQSDNGTENNGIANAQTRLRQYMDPSLEGTLQHKFTGHVQNIKPEIFWKQLRSRWTPGFEDLIQFGVLSGLYNPENMLERLVFHYVFIPFLQRELDLFRERYNHSMPRANKHKALPRGRPDDIFHNPEEFGSKDFSVGVDLEHLAEIRNEFASPDHFVHQLVPPPFQAQADRFMEELQMPTVEMDTAWDIYQNLLIAFQELTEPNTLQNMMSTRVQPADVGEEFPAQEIMPVLPLQEYRDKYPLPQSDSESESDEDDMDADEGDTDDILADMLAFSDEGFESSDED